MNYKLIATDVDGTLLNSNSVLTQATIQGMKDVVDKGVLFTISTGRPAAGVAKFADILDKDMPFIIFNGAVVVMSKSGHVLYRCGLDMHLVKKIIDFGKALNTTMVIWSESNLYAFELNERVLKYKSISGVDPILIKDIDELKDETIIKILWNDETEKISEFQVDMQKKMGKEVNCHTSRPYYLEFVSLGASKAIALQKIEEKFGIKPDETIAIGDGYNDISMLQYAGLGVAMGNAPSEIKEIADITAPTNDNDGVLYIIKKYILNDGVV
ncbi:MAG: HAD family phosphatase [Clostridiaceae bacterium]|nr:HAD family phosphatase [Clostridiaceae bacterium]